MKKLKMAVIGCGGICKSVHISAYETMENVEVVAFCDVIEERAVALVERYGSGKAYTDYNEVLNIEGLEAIDICTPNYLHSIIAVAALEKGLHVFCEKPDAVSVEEALKMKAASEKSGKTLMIMRNNRYLPTSEFLKSYIEDGSMGEVYAGRCGWQRRRGIPGKGGWFTTKEKSGGGPLIDLGVHMLDVAIWLMGNPTPVAVSGSTYCKFANVTSSDSVNSKFGDAVAGGTFDVEDLAMGFIKFDNGACLQFEVSWASNVDEEKRYVELRGDKAGAIMSVGAAGDQFKIMSEINGQVVDIIPTKVKNDGVNAHGLNIKHFVDVILNDAEPKFVPQQGLNMIKILAAIYESAETGKEVVL